MYKSLKIDVRKILAVMAVGTGLCLMSYPWISNRVYSHAVDSKVEVYRKEIAETGSDEVNAILDEARQYNIRLAESKVELTDPFIFSEAESWDITYESVLSMNSSGLMCFVEIPKIDICLPVYHGTSGEVLEKGAGHLEGSSVPVGGEGTHAVLSAHTGINSAKMFTDLTEMEEGDLFFIHVLDETLAYRVCDIRVILPKETESLVIEEGRDLVSLLTCTPYGVNSHRLVVTGERTEYTETAKTEMNFENADTGSQWMKAYGKAILIGLAVVIILVVTINLYRYTAEKVKRDREGTV